MWQIFQLPRQHPAAKMQELKFEIAKLPPNHQKNIFPR